LHIAAIKLSIRRTTQTGTMICVNCYPLGVAEARRENYFGSKGDEKHFIDRRWR
jgi:hypothetical protein